MNVFLDYHCNFNDRYIIIYIKSIINKNISFKIKYNK